MKAVAKSRPGPPARQDSAAATQRAPAQSSGLPQSIEEPRIGPRWRIAPGKRSCHGASKRCGSNRRRILHRRSGLEKMEGQVGCGDGSGAEKDGVDGRGRGCGLDPPFGEKGAQAAQAKRAWAFR